MQTPQYFHTLLAIPAVWMDVYVRYLNNRGTLAEERWKALKWTRPEDETTQCWWLVFTVKLAHVVVRALPLLPPMLLNDTTFHLFCCRGQRDRGRPNKGTQPPFSFRWAAEGGTDRRPVCVHCEAAQRVPQEKQ